MKRKLVMAVILSAALMAAGCSNGNTNTTEVQTETEAASEEANKEPRPEYKALDYVTLGEYKGLPVTLASTEVTEDDIKAEITSQMSQSEKIETLTEGTVENGDIANIDYEGTKDGVAFDGGTDKGYDLTIGSGTFVPGFESGLVGKKIGETVDLNLTFPENYGGDLGGQDVVFRVTINSVKRAPELTDELVKELSDSAYEKVADYKKSIEETLTEQKKSTQESQKINDLMTQAYNNATFNEYPEDVVAYDLKQYIDYYEDYAEQAEQTLEEFVQSNYSITEESFRAQSEDQVKNRLSQEMLLKAIAEAEKLTISDEEYKKGAEEYAAQYGFDSVAALEEQYGKAVVEENLLMDKALEVVKGSAVIEGGDTTEKVTETETETETKAE